MKILVTGGCGYKGSVLVPKLLNAGHEVIVVDTMWFGNVFEQSTNENLQVLKVDIRDTDLIPMEGVNAIIHLASVANDPCVDFDPLLSWEINVLATMRLMEKAKKFGVKQFIFASSGSVYGVSEDPKVVETTELLPISKYNKTKMVGERVILSYQDDMTVQIVRPATVCGISPRMRFDVSVNILTISALEKGKITVFGGDQVRPNIHMEDITNIYMWLLDQGDRVQGIFNAGFENMSIMDIAKLVQSELGTEIEVTPSNDPRSYRLNSDKLLAAGFKPQFSVHDAVKEIIQLHKEGKLKSDPSNFNIKWMKEIEIAPSVVN